MLWVKREIGLERKMYCILIYKFMQHHNDTIIKTDTGSLLYNYIVRLTLLQGFESVVQGFHVRGRWRPNRTAIF